MNTRTLRHKLTMLSFITLLLIFVCAPAAFAADADVQYQLVNKEHLLSSDYVPEDLVRLNSFMSAEYSAMMTREAADAMKTMIAAMKAAGITDIHAQSGYRSYSVQSTLYANKTAYYRNRGYGESEARTLAATVVAVPGSSEHQTGLAMDFTTSSAGLTEYFAETAAGKWLAANSWKYGFILRYPKGKEDITGYIYEPWHFRYVGKIHAEYIHRYQLTLDEYYDKLKTESVVTLESLDGNSYAIYLNPTKNTANIAGTVLEWSQAFAGDKYSQIYTATVPDIPLFDAVGHWAENDIRILNDMQIVTGYPNNTFRPGRNIIRAELVTLVAKLYSVMNEQGIDADSAAYIQAMIGGGFSPYGDVPAGAYYLEPLLILAEADALPAGQLYKDAYGADCFRPTDPALRSDAALLIAELFRGREVADIYDVTYTDMTDRDPQLLEAVDLLTDAGVILGDPSGTFRPDSSISRAEICAMLCRAMRYCGLLY